MSATDDGAAAASGSPILNARGGELAGRNRRVHAGRYPVDDNVPI